MSDYSPEEIWNTDQMGFNQELHSLRTLSYVGEKNTHLQVGSVSAATHSYTIQPIISMDGRLLSPVFICLQEPSGRLGPTVESRMLKLPNVSISCSKSGKLTKTHIEYWCRNVLRPNVKGTFLFYGLFKAKIFVCDFSLIVCIIAFPIFNLILV